MGSDDLPSIANLPGAKHEMQGADEEDAMSGSVKDIAASYGIELPDCRNDACLFGDGAGMRIASGKCRCVEGTSRETTILLRRLALLVKRMKRDTSAKERP